MTDMTALKTSAAKMDAAISRFVTISELGDGLEFDRDNIKRLADKLMLELRDIVDNFDGDGSAFAHDVSGIGDTIDDAFDAAIRERDREREEARALLSERAAMKAEIERLNRHINEIEADANRDGNTGDAVCCGICVPSCDDIARAALKGADHD